MPEISKDSVLAALKQLRAPASEHDVLTLNLVRNVTVSDGVVRVEFDLPNQAAQVQDQLRSDTIARLRSQPGVTDVIVEIAVRPPPRASTHLPGVKHVIAVGAGKGGVGKSTVAVLLAVGLKRLGYRTALLDADVYGPSLPKLMGMEGMQPEGDDQGRIIPPAIGGIPCMSIGFVIPSNEAVVWRGPMAQKYVKEFLDRGLWGEVDFLIVDLPPGTGDIPLTLAQSVPLTGAVVVCTPQDVALLDAVKALRMYQRLNVEILGIVENMSYYLCPHCGRRDEIFSSGGARKAAEDLDVPFLGEIPLNVNIRVHGDEGTPAESFTRTEPHVSAALEAFVRRTAEEIERRARSRTRLPQLKVTG